MGYLLGLAVLTGLVFLPALWFGLGTADSTYEETTITSYAAEFTIDENGDLSAREDLDVNFPYSGKHGIFRFWDVVDPSEPHARRIPRDIEVARDGGEDEVTMLTESRGRYRVARIGREAYQGRAQTDSILIGITRVFEHGTGEQIAIVTAGEVGAGPWHLALHAEVQRRDSRRARH